VRLLLDLWGSSCTEPPHVFGNPKCCFSMMDSEQPNHHGMIALKKSCSLFWEENMYTCIWRMDRSILRTDRSILRTDRSTLRMDRCRLRIYEAVPWWLSSRSISMRNKIDTAIWLDGKCIRPLYGDYTMAFSPKYMSTNVVVWKSMVTVTNHLLDHLFYHQGGYYLKVVVTVS
jgi:hypothetical protein